MSVTWSKKDKYLYNKKLGGYLHIYIMKKWYGEQQYKTMQAQGYVIDHLDNQGTNCCINNLAFLHLDENIAKGMTVDKMSAKKTHIALSIYNDFETQLKQITIVFNYPAIAKISTVEKPAGIELAYLLYNIDYSLVVNDARQILYKYQNDYTFEPEKLNHIDYRIEGKYGIPIPVGQYDEYMKGGHGYAISFFNKKAPLKNWTLANQQEYLYLRGE